MAMIDNLEAMLTDGRDDAMLRFGLGSAYFNQGELPSAVSHLEACIAHDASYAAAYKLLGKSYFQLSKYNEALRVLQAGLPVAIKKGDKQSQKEIEVFLKKTQKVMSDG
ncbi:MAG: tetratricopeptide (TPR) repeat protein [Candidatus Azotimanducaceae bacterium]|jgi:tetratricopeptide (TPR) repeat protein